MPLNEEQLRNRFQTVVQLVGAGAVLMYVAGFLVLSLYYASFGITQINLFRPKTVAAGILFVVLAALPAIETLQVLDIRNKHKEGSVTLVWLFSTGLWVLAAVGSNVLLRPFLVGTSIPESFFSWEAALIPSVAVIAAIPVIPRTKKWAVPLAIILFVLAFSWMAFSVFRTRDRTFWVMIGWFLWCGWLTLQIRGGLREPQKLRAANWIFIVTLAMSLTTFFGVQVYRRVPSGFGGGAPGPITVEFLDKSPLDGALRDQVWLIDETDAGFYVVQKEEARQAVFLPRTIVRVIYFGKEPESLKPQNMGSEQKKSSQPNTQTK